jgi:hypothetical protein
MGRERRHHADVFARLRYRAAHPVRTLGLVTWLSCVCMLIGASAPAHSAEHKHTADFFRPAVRVLP